MHVTDGDPVEVTVDLEAGGRREPGPGRPLGAAAARRRPLGRRGDVRGARPTCRWATTGSGPAPAAPTRPCLIVTPAWLGLPESVRRPALVGPGHAALQRPLAAVLGRRRPRRPHRPRRLVRRRARRRLRAGQPAARRRAGRAARALAVPAHLAPVLQPALRAGRADRGVRRPAGRRARDGRRARRRRARPPRRTST